MYKITETYTDYLGKERTEDFFFNLSKSEIVEMEFGKDGGLSSIMQKASKEMDVPKLIVLFKDLVLDAYGEISEDGRQFVKNEQLRNAFAQTEAYSNIFMRFVFDAEAASDFVNGIFPKGLTEMIEAQISKANKPLA